MRVDFQDFNHITLYGQEDVKKHLSLHGRSHSMTMSKSEIGTKPEY